MKLIIPFTLTSLFLFCACESSITPKKSLTVISKHNYKCKSGEIISATYSSSDSVSLQYKNNHHKMKIAISGSGSRYVDNSLEWWTKGSGIKSEATLLEHNSNNTSGKIIEYCREF